MHWQSRFKPARQRRNAQLSHRQLRHRQLRHESLESRQMMSANSVAPMYLVQPQAGSGIVGYTPAQIRAAYGFTATSFGGIAADGRGQTIAIIDAYHDPNIVADLANFDAALGIAAPPSFQIVNQTGGSVLPGTDPAQGWAGETALDVEWAHAIAPGANILLVEANSDADSDLFAAVNWARNQPGVSVISMSWGSDDNARYASYDQGLSSQYLVTPAGHQGITFVAASGDHGVPTFPATSPNVLAVGGTDLYLTSSNTISRETAWTPTTSGHTVWSGGGGTSAEFAGRNTPDVSYNAGVGVAVYDTFGPSTGWGAVDGTSAGAPQWAALIAIANQGRALNGLGSLDGATQTKAALYAAPSADFHDITTGSTQYQTATVGYDLATGLGSPVANLLIPYLAGYGSAASVTRTSVSSSAATNITTSSATLGGNVSSDGGGAITARGVLVSQTAVDVSPMLGDSGVVNFMVSGTTGAFTVNDTGLQPGTNYSYVAYATNSAGTTYSAVRTFNTSAPVVNPQGVSVQLVGTQLVVTGDNRADQIQVAGDGVAREYVVTAINGTMVNGVINGSVTVRGVDSMQVNLTAGADVFTLDGANLAGDVTIGGGSGDKTINVGKTSAVVLGGNLAIDGGAGNDVIYVNQTYPTGSMTIVGGRGGVTNQITTAFSVIGKDLTITGAAGYDQVQQTQVGIGGKWTIDVGAGNDLISAAQCAATGAATFTSGIGIDTIAIAGCNLKSTALFDGSAGGGSKTLWLYSSVLGGATTMTGGAVNDFGDTITYENNTGSTLTLNGGVGADTVALRTSILDRLYANLGDGNDSLEIKYTHVKTSAQIDGGSGSDTLHDIGNLYDTPLSSQNVEVLSYT